MRPLSGLRGILAAVLAVSVFSNLLVLAVPLYMLQIYDRVLTSRSTETLLYLTIIVVALLLVMAVLEWLRGKVLARCGEWLDRQHHGRLVELTLRGEAPATLLQDARQLRNFFASPAAGALFDAPTVPLYLAGVYLLHWQLGLIASLGFVVLLVLGALGELLTRKPVAIASERFAETDRLAGAVARNAEAVRAMGMAPAFTARWEQLQEEGMGAQVTASERGVAVQSLARAWRLLLQVAMLGWGAFLALGGIISAGAIIAASIIASRGFAPAETLLSNWRNLLLARASHRRLAEHLGSAPQTPEAEHRLQLPRARGEIRVEQLTVRFGAGLPPVLKAVSFALAPGDILGVAGPSGSGKTTLARSLVGLLPPSAGQVRLDGFELGSWDRDQLAGSVGYLPQTVQLFEGRIDSNIARFGTIDDAAVVQAARVSGAREVIARLPEGFNTPLDAAGAPLSGGQLQRIALARAFYGNPALVVLDEPTSNLDSEGEACLRQLLEHARKQGTTVIVIAHRPNVLAATDRMLVLQDGTVAQEGPSREVLARIVRQAVPEGMKIGAGQDAH